VGVVRSLPKSGAPERYIERPVRDKYSSLLQKFVNFGQKNLYNIDTRCQ
jgi:hypothetical protein